MAYSITTDCIGCQACRRICPATAISGEKKEAHTIDVDLCIECGACGRVCPAAAVKDAFGVTAIQVKKKEWEQPVIDLDTCMSCGICMDACPAGALDEVLQKKNNPHAFPVLTDASICMGCGFCARDCPVSAITMTAREIKQEAAPQEA